MRLLYARSCLVGCRHCDHRSVKDNDRDKKEVRRSHCVSCHFILLIQANELLEVFGNQNQNTMMGKKTEEYVLRERLNRLSRLKPCKKKKKISLSLPPTSLIFYCEFCSSIFALSLSGLFSFLFFFQKKLKSSRCPSLLLLNKVPFTACGGQIGSLRCTK
jgi:hypothetical protein